MALWVQRLRHLQSLPTVAWLGALLALVTIAVLWPPHAKQEVCIRWWGMVLQMFGIYSVLRELLERRKDVGTPNLLTALKLWFAAWPGRNLTIPLSGNAMVITGGTARVTQRAGPPGPDASIEDRLTTAEKNIKFIDDDLGRVESALDAERRAREIAVRDEKDERIQAIDSIKNAMKEAAAKTLPFSMFGVVWLALGVFLSSTSVELERWAHLLHR